MNILLLPDPILVHILSYFNFFEVGILSRVNKQFHRVRKDHIVLVKPPTGEFVSNLFRIHKDLCESYNNNISYKDRFSCPGCSILQVVPNILLQSIDAHQVQASLLVLTTADRRNVLNDDGNGNVTLLVKGVFNHLNSDHHYESILKVLYQVFPECLGNFDTPIFIGGILDFLIDRIFTLIVVEKQGIHIITLEDVLEMFPLVLSGELLKHAIVEGNKATVRSIQFDFDGVQSQIAAKFPQLQLDHRTIVFFAAVFEYISAEIWEFGGIKAREQGATRVEVAHLIMGIQADRELREAFKLEQFLPILSKNRSRHERLLKGTIVTETSDAVVIETEPFPIRFENFMNDRVTELYESHQIQTNSVEGVLFADNFIQQNLHKSLMDNINKFASGQQVNLEENNREVLDPALYSYVEGISEFVPSADLPFNPRPFDDKLCDLWGRPFLRSRFQCLPTYIDSQKDGSWRFRDEINNLPKKGNEALYQNLEDIFSFCVPYLEQVIGYTGTLKPEKFDTVNTQFPVSYSPSFDNRSSPHQNYIKPYKLKGKSLQVICKIVDIESRSERVHDWHVKGIPQENILATCEYTAELAGHNFMRGRIQFERCLHKEERFVLNNGQKQAPMIRNLIRWNICPLGCVEMKAGRLIVFPNTHMQKVLFQDREVGRMRSVVFLVVNPEIRIVSTQEVIPKSQREAISNEQALQLRLELLKERNPARQILSL